jgi:hypothetical protein
MGARNACVALALLLAACGGGGSDGGAPAPAAPPAPPLGATPPANAEVSLLFLGNSHTSSNDLAGMVVHMVRAGARGKTVGSAVAPGVLFLDERLGDSASVALLRSQRWSFVILQAQKYSASGQVEYSTEEAKSLVRMSREQGAVPIMFPEWPRRDIDETQRIYELHASIARAEPACVAPVGQAWDLALDRDPSLPLYAADGNHSEPDGAFLAALVLYATITGQSPLGVPALPQYPVAAARQEVLRGIAAETVQTVPPKMWCPGD